MFEKCYEYFYNTFEYITKVPSKKKILGTRLFPFEILHEGVEKGWDTSCSNYL